MTSDRLLPLTDEQAKLAREIVASGRDLGGYLAEILGDLPKDLIGVLLGDRVKAWRAERIAILWQGVKKRLNDRGITDPKPPSLKLALPILAAAADENRQELRDLWERLLAAAMDPKRQSFVRHSLIETVKQLDSFDVLVFRVVTEYPHGNMAPTGRDFIKTRLQSSEAEVLVSFANLERLNCIAFASNPHITPLIAPLGTLLINAVRD